MSLPVNTTAEGQNALRLSINPTYDSRKTGHPYTVETRVNGRRIRVQEIADPFVRTTVRASVLTCLASVFRGGCAVEVIVNATPVVTEDVMELNNNYIGHGSTRRAEFRASIETALREAGDTPSVPDGNDKHLAASDKTKTGVVTRTQEP